MTTFDDMEDLRTSCCALPHGNHEAERIAAARQEQLTKPPGSLGRLEELAVWMARWQGVPIPVLEKASVVVFAGNHGIAQRGVSAYPAEVTG